ncbi:testis-expressed protein 44 [Erinaceus europaeus]|uniref:Testis-expressed protein 44 n=1 Tax=Erinaceus europaeus TaxID=9365 RepID=A0A1S2ZJL5_ERIEU|nr:testis-expressed protein 44 [Erinaceus europaeus]
MTSVAEATSNSTYGDLTPSSSRDSTTGSSQSRALVLPYVPAASTVAASNEHLVNQASVEPETLEATPASEDREEHDTAAEPDQEPGEATTTKDLPSYETLQDAEGAKLVQDSTVTQSPQTPQQDSLSEKDTPQQQSVPDSKPEATPSALRTVEREPEVPPSPSTKLQKPEIILSPPSTEHREPEATPSLSAKLQDPKVILSPPRTEQEEPEAAPPLSTKLQKPEIILFPPSSTEQEEPEVPSFAPSTEEQSPQNAIMYPMVSNSHLDARAADTPETQKPKGPEALNPDLKAWSPGMSQAVTHGDLDSEDREANLLLRSPRGSASHLLVPQEMQGWRRVDSSVYCADTEIDYMRSVTSLLGGGEAAMSSLADILAWSENSLDVATGLLESGSGHFSNMLRIAGPRLRSVSSILGIDSSGLRTRLEQMPSATLRSLHSLTNVLEAAEQRTLEGIRWALRFLAAHIIPRLVHAAPNFS